MTTDAAPFAQQDVSINGDNLREAIVRAIRRDIFSGRLKLGSKIDQDALAEAFGVSRLPVREALISLEREGLVVWAARRGTYVADLTEDDFRDHFEILALVSGLAARRAVEKLTDEQITEWEQHIQRLFDAAEEAANEPQLQQALDGFFFQSGGLSHRLTHEFLNLARTIPQWMFIDSPLHVKRSRKNAARMAQAMRARDGDAAATIMAEGVRQRTAEYMDQLRAGGLWDDAGAGSGSSAPAGKDQDSGKRRGRPRRANR